MNSNQRKQQKKSMLKLANKFADLIEELLNDLESGKATIKSAKQDLAETRKVLKEIV